MLIVAVLAVIVKLVASVIDQAPQVKIDAPEVRVLTLTFEELKLEQVTVLPLVSNVPASKFTCTDVVRF